MRELRALRILEFQAIRDRLVGCCETEMAKLVAEDIAPAFEETEVWKQLGESCEAYDLMGTKPPPGLGGVRDTRNALRMASKGAVLGGQELYQIGFGLSAIRTLKGYLDEVQSPLLAEIGIGLVFDQKVEGELLFSLESDGTVQDAASPSLAEIRAKKRGAQARILERIQSYVNGKSRDYLSDPIYTVREGRYVVPLKAEHRGKIKGIVHDTSATGSTIYVEPEDVLNAANSARQLEGQEREEEKRILTLLSRRVAHIAEATSGALTFLGQLDLVFGKARLAAEMKANKPERVAGYRIEIRGGRHPLLDTKSVVPIDIDLSAEASVLITGPNTGGKTVAIKTVGLFVAMMQCGLLPPALNCKFGYFTQLWADIGDEQSIEQSLSTFSAHLKNIASALNNLQAGALVMLDEAGAGTDPAEGAALARAILVELRLKGAVTLASTHYGELKAFAFSTPGFINASMEFDAKSLKPTYKLILGAAGASQALKIAERYGIDRHIIERAKEGLSEQQQDVAEMLQELENAQKRARVAQGEADRRAAELRELEVKADRKLREAEDIRKRANEKAHDAIENALRDIRIQADDIIENLKKQGGNQQGLQAARENLRSLDEKGRTLSKKFRPQEQVSKDVRQHVFQKGDIVQVIGFQQNGTLLDVPGARDVMVQLGAIKMKVDIRKILPTNVKAEAPRSNRHQIGLTKTLNAKTELTLRNMRAEVAVQELERFVDDAILGNVPFVRIVHGKGEGILRQVTQDYLRQHRDVKTVRDGDATEGGQGVTIAQFK
jgi:DNA mismatch repair protein MutS2